MIDAVIFDMDGLLIDSEPFWREAEKDIFHSVGITMTDSMCEEIMGLRIDEVVKYWHRRYPWKEPGLDVVAGKIVEGVIDRVLEKGKPMDGVHETLSFFENRAIPIALATSSMQRLVDAVLQTLGLIDKFAVVQSAEKLAYGKPHPEIFLTTARQLAVEPSHCLVFEDSFNGLIAAKAARMKVVAVPEQRLFNDPKFGIADLKIRTLNRWDDGLWQKLQN